MTRVPPVLSMRVGRLLCASRFPILKLMQRAYMSSAMMLLSALLVAACGGDGDSGIGPGEDGGLPDGEEGSRIEQYIRGDEASRLVIEIDHTEGFAPYGNTMTRLPPGLEDILDKPDGVEIMIDEVLEPRGDDHVWERSDLFDLAASTNDLSVPEGTAKIHVLLLDGQDENDSDSGVILGLAWDHLQIAIYKQTLEEGCETVHPIEQRLCEAAELSVLTHEVGHTLGLVNNGLPMVMDHEDPDHSKHEVMEDCVMYWAYERGAGIDRIRQRIMGGSMDPASLGFCQPSLDDIAAFREM